MVTRVKFHNKKSLVILELCFEFVIIVLFKVKKYFKDVIFKVEEMF